MSEHRSKLQIDIVSDVVCPWCIIGYKQLERALEQEGLKAEITWHPFELNPQMAPEGENLRAHLAAKYGTTLEDSIRARKRLTELGAELGFSFNYADDMWMFNTNRAHQLLHWAEAKGHQHDLKMALFEAFFTHRQDVSDAGVLVKVAASIGLPEDEATEVLADGRFEAAVREAENDWLVRGVHGVPAMIFERKHLVSGAQGVDNYVQVLKALRSEQAA